MKKAIVLYIFFVFHSGLYAQTLDSIAKPTQLKSNPIIYFDTHVGVFRSDQLGFSVGGSLNYQYKNHLFTGRVAIYAQTNGWFFFIPTSTNETEELSILYGKRYVYEGAAFSFSGGFSRLQQTKYSPNQVTTSNNFYGFPFEVNYTFFNNEKRRFRILYGLIPIGKPVAFGRSIGFKLYGNIAKTSFVGIGINVGLGFHKKY